VKVLQEIGYAVHVCRNGREALATLSRAPALVLVNTDPESGGVADFVKRLHRLRGMSTVPVVATHTGEPPSRKVQSALMEAGVGAFLPHPFAPADVMGAVSTANGLGTLPEFLPVTRPGRRAAPEAELPRPRVSTLPSAGGLPNFTPVTSPRLGTTSDRVTSAAPSAIGEVAATMLSADGELECVVLSATPKRVIVRLDAIVGPRVDDRVRLHVLLRDATKDLPVRLLGSVLSSEPVGAALKLTISIEIANPRGNLEHLTRYLLRHG
jgi:hypothetical protein